MSDKKDFGDFEDIQSALNEYWNAMECLHRKKNILIALVGGDYIGCIDQTIHNLVNLKSMIKKEIEDKHFKESGEG